jgi:two-component system cell cycle response regulator
MKINDELLKEVKILYVEDDEDVMDGALKFLKRRFTTVYSALNGKEGLEVFMQNSPDIVVTDIKMPVMDGLDMAKQIKETNPDTPVIITTAYTEVSYLMQAIEIGVDSYVLKPIVNENLYDTVCKCASRFIYKKMMEAKNRLVQTIMDWNPCFSILISGDNLDYVNKTFLNFTGYETMAEFLKHHECVDDFIVAVGKEKTDSKASDKWFKQIINNPETDHVVYIKAKDSDNIVPYLVKYEHFREIDQYIFAFICPDEAAKNHVKTV